MSISTCRYNLQGCLQRPKEKVCSAQNINYRGGHQAQQRGRRYKMNTTGFHCTWGAVNPDPCKIINVCNLKLRKRSVPQPTPSKDCRTC